MLSQLEQKQIMQFHMLMDMDLFLMNSMRYLNYCEQLGVTYSYKLSLKKWQLLIKFQYFCCVTVTEKKLQGRISIHRPQKCAVSKGRLFLQSGKSLLCVVFGCLIFAKPQSQ